MMSSKIEDIDRDPHLEIKSQNFETNFSDKIDTFQWMSQLLDRVLKYRNPNGCNLAVWGKQSDLAALVFLIRGDKKFWSVCAIDSDRKHLESLAPWLKSEKLTFEPKYNEWSAHHTVYIFLNAEAQNYVEIMNSVPKGILIVGLWRISSDQSARAIAKSLNLRCPLWISTEKDYPKLGGSEKHALLAFSKT